MNTKSAQTQKSQSLQIQFVFRCLLLVAFSLSLGSPAFAALTKHDENDEAVTALTEDINKWTLDADRANCSQGEGILKSANEFLTSSKLDDGQMKEAKTSSEKLEVALRETCESQSKK